MAARVGVAAAVLAVGVLVVAEVAEVGVERPGVLTARALFRSLSPDGAAWADGSVQRADVTIWCTGFRPGLGHLTPPSLHRISGRVTVEGTRVVGEPRAYLLGYGDWTGPASATVI